jgi:hypothetical protein
LGVGDQALNQFLPPLVALQHLHQLRLLGRVLQVSGNAVQQHRDRRADDFQVTEFLRRDIHQEIILVRVRSLGRESLHKILHRRFQLAIGTAELLQQHRGETIIRPGNPGIELQFFDMVEHRIFPYGWTGERALAGTTGQAPARPADERRA